MKYSDIESSLKKDHATLSYDSSQRDMQTKPSRAAKPHEICVQLATNPRSFSYLTIRETTPLEPQIRALLQLPHSPPVFLSRRGSLLPEDATASTLSRTTDEVITVHQTELTTLWKGTSTACDLSLLQAFGTNAMIGGHEINQVLRWALWVNTTEWGLSPHRRAKVHIFCTFAWMHLETAYRKFIENSDWPSFKQTLGVPELGKPAAATTICVPINIPDLHWYFSVLLLH